MFTPTDASGSSSSSNNNNNFSLLNICSKVKLDNTNYNVWTCNIKMDLRFEDKEYILEKPLDENEETKATREEMFSYIKHYNDATKVAYIMLATMTSELQRHYEDYWP